MLRQRTELHSRRPAAARKARDGLKGLNFRLRSKLFIVEHRLINLTRLERLLLHREEIFVAATTDTSARMAISCRGRANGARSWELMRPAAGCV